MIKNNLDCYCKPTIKSLKGVPDGSVMSCSVPRVFKITRYREGCIQNTTEKRLAVENVLNSAGRSAATLIVALLA